MSFGRRLDALEEFFDPDRHRCAECGPTPRYARPIVLEEDDELPICTKCGEPVDERGRSLGPNPSIVRLFSIRAVAPPERAVPAARPWVSEDGEIWLWARAAPGDLPWPSREVAPLGDRGSVLRVLAAEVPCGTPAKNGA